jgi:hypothetical protein
LIGRFPAINRRNSFGISRRAMFDLPREMGRNGRGEVIGCIAVYRSTSKRLEILGQSSHPKGGYRTYEENGSAGMIYITFPFFFLFSFFFFLFRWMCGYCMQKTKNKPIRKTNQACVAVSGGVWPFRF